jgi:thiamine-phosphate pyrophosphorylase
MTDARLGVGLWAALAAVPRGGGVIFRHDGEPGRLALGGRVRAVALRRGLAFVVAGEGRAAARLRAQGLHRREAAMRPGWPCLPAGAGAGAPPGGWRTASAHGVAGLVAARRARAHLVFVGPVFTTASHPGAPALGHVRLGLMLRQARTRALGPAVAALGGMTGARLPALRGLGVATWGGIDAFAPRRPA